MPRFGNKNMEEKCMYKKILSFILAITMPVASLVFAKDYSAYAQKFYDVDKSHWAFEYISELADKNIINGYSDGSFLPERTVTRAEWAKLMCVASGKQEENNISPYAIDYTENDWYFGYVNAVADYMNFYEDGNKLYFIGNQAISREDVTVSLVKMKGVAVDDVDFSYISQFDDINSISKNAKKYVAAAVEKGLINGYEDNTFRGQDTLTRAQAAKLLSCASKIGSDNKVTDVSDYNSNGSSSASVTNGQMKNVNNTSETYPTSDNDTKSSNNNNDCYPNTVIPSYGKITGQKCVTADIMEGLAIYMYNCNSNSDLEKYMTVLRDCGWYTDGGEVNEEKQLMTVVFTKGEYEVDMSIYFAEQQVLIYFEGDESNLESDTKSALSKNGTQTAQTEKQSKNVSSEKDEDKNTTQTEKKSNKDYKVAPILEIGLENYKDEMYVATQVGDDIYFVPDGEKCIKKLNILTTKTENYMNFDDDTVSIDDEEYKISKIISLYYDSNRESLCASCKLERYDVLSSNNTTKNALINIDNMKAINTSFNYYCFGADTDGSLIVHHIKRGNKIPAGVAVLDSPDYHYSFTEPSSKKEIVFHGGKSFPLYGCNTFDVKLINSQMYFFTSIGIRKATDNSYEYYGYKTVNFYDVKKVIDCDDAAISADDNGFYVINNENLIWLDLNGKVQKSCALSKIDTSECSKDSFPKYRVSKMFISSTGDIVFYSLSDEAFMKISKL